MWTHSQTIRPRRGVAAALGLVVAGLLAASGVAAPDQDASKTAETKPPVLPPVLPPVQPPVQPPVGATAPPSKRPEPQRVVVRVSRNTEVQGYIELEDEEILVIRRRNGGLESFAKSRIVQIIRLIDPGEGRDGMVVLRNGERRSGVILEDEFDHVLLEIEGVRREKFRGAVVDYLRLAPTFDEQYAAFKAILDPKMGQQHLELCKWLVGERRYDLAAQELETLMKNHVLPEAIQLQRVVRAQLALIADREKRELEGRNESEETEDRPALEFEAPGKLLTHADVNLIRVYELDFKNPPKVAVSRAAIAALIQQHGASELIPRSDTARSALYDATPLQIVELMFQLKARDLYPMIEVQTEPKALNLFRQRVHNTWLMNGCATSGCHGGTNAGRLFLHRRNYKDERVRNTNMLILERLKIDPKWPLVNYQRPMDSLIIQYGLPRAQARMPHPAARGWKSVFRHPDDRMVKGAIEWIEAMLEPRPDYPIDFEPPRLRAGKGDPAVPGAPGMPDR